MSTCRYGMSALLSCAGAEECAAVCSELGLYFVELNQNLPAYLPGNLNVQTLRQLQEKTGVRFTFHLPEALNPFDFSPEVAAAYREEAVQTIRIARELAEPDDAVVVNMHMPEGVYFTLPDRRIYLMEVYAKEFGERLRQFREECASEAGKQVLICVENCEGFHPWQKQALSFLLESPSFGLTWDVGHDDFSGGADRTFLMEHANRIRHMHLHDGGGEGKSPHLPFGTGKIDLPSRFRFAVEHGCTSVIEVKTVEALVKSVEWMKQRNWL